MSRDQVGPGDRPTTAYYLTFAAAMVGMVCVAIAIQGTYRLLRGQDGLGALNQAGVAALIFAWALAYYARLAFADTVSPATRTMVIGSLRVIFWLEIAIAAAGTWYVVASGAASGDLLGIMIVGDLLQIGTLVWLLRHAR